MSIGRILKSAVSAFGRSRRGTTARTGTATHGTATHGHRKDPKAAVAQKAVNELGKRL